MTKEQFDLWRTEIELMTNTNQMMELRLRLRSTPSVVFERDLGLQLLEAMVSQRLLVVLWCPPTMAGWFLSQLSKPGSHTFSSRIAQSSSASSSSNPGAETLR